MLTSCNFCDSKTVPIHKLMAAALLVLLLLLAVSSTAFTTTDVYYVTADDAAGQCPPHQICHNLSYYISQPDYYYYFTSDTTIIFLEGVHSFEHSYEHSYVIVGYVHNLTLKGQGQWPVAGAEETVMQSTVIINCTRGRGGFYFDTCHDITVEGLTVVNCSGARGIQYSYGIFTFISVRSLLFHKNSIQHMTGYGLYVYNCNNAIITNCSYYHTALCDISVDNHSEFLSGGIFIVYKAHNIQYSNTTLELSYSNMTKCCGIVGGGLTIDLSHRGQLDISFNNLKFSYNKATRLGGGIFASLVSGIFGSGDVTLVVSNCIFFNGTADYGGGMNIDVEIPSFKLIIDTTVFLNNGGASTSDIFIVSFKHPFNTKISMINSKVFTKSYSYCGVFINGASVHITNTSMRFVNKSFGFMLLGIDINNTIRIDGCHFNGSTVVTSVIYLNAVHVRIINCLFSNNTSGHSVVKISDQAEIGYVVIHSCNISDNNMTGITLIQAVATFSGRNVIQNNRNTDGAGITMFASSYIIIEGELLFYNNTADKHGGAVLATQPTHSLMVAIALRLLGYTTIFASTPCTMTFKNNSSSVIFSGNRAGKGGSDMYGAILMGCSKAKNRYQIPHLGHPNENSWYFDTPLMKYLHFSNTDRLSSMSSDPIMVCFCNTTTNLPDCSARTHHIQTYPGLEINTSIATVGYYGGTSPGDVQVTAQHATLVQTYGKNYETTNCFQLHILLQNTSSTTALVDIRVKNVVQGLGVSIGVDILECPIGFTQISGQCHCERFLDTSDVRCNLSATPFKFLRQGNSWFGYINNSQCITGTNNCHFDYCSRSNVSFDIMAPDRQCVANRTSILCGQCQPHLSVMLGSNHCGTCSNWYLFLLPVFALAGMVLVAVLMFLNLSVSVGTINGLLFYANMVKLNEAFFFPNGSVPVVSQFISWLNLDLGIEVCLFDGLDGYWNTWLQFIFPAYLFLLMGGIIVGCRYSVWFCRLCGSHAVPALATLFLMSYTKILLTVTNALSMSQLPCNDSILTVWSVDGNIEYGSGKHLILVVVSCGVLVIGLAYPVLVLCAPLLEKYSHKCIPQHCRWNPVAKFKPLLDAYGGPYKDNYRFWTGVTLMVRLTVTVTFSFTSGPINAYIIITIVVGILTFWSFTKGVYESIYVSLLEVFYVLNIFLLSTVSLATASLGSRDYQIATIVSVCLSLVVCVVVMAMHLLFNFDLKKIKRRLGFKDRIEYIAVPQMAANEDDEEDHPHEEHESSSPVLLAREPLLFDT